MFTLLLKRSLEHLQDFQYALSPNKQTQYIPSKHSQCYVDNIIIAHSLRCWGQLHELWLSVQNSLSFKINNNRGEKFLRLVFIGLTPIMFFFPVWDLEDEDGKYPRASWGVQPGKFVLVGHKDSSYTHMNHV